MQWIYELLLAGLFSISLYRVWKQRRREQEILRQKICLEEYVATLTGCYRTYRNVEMAVEEADDGKFQNMKLPYAQLVRKLCSLTAEMGDSVWDGTSLFQRNLSYMREEMKEDILFCQQKKYCFRGLSKLCAVPFFLIPFLGIWAQGVLDSFSAYYQGTFAIITTTICFVITQVCYQMTAWCEMPDYTRKLDYRAVRRLLKNKWILADANRCIQRRYRFYLRKNEKLKLLQGYGNIREFLVKKRCSAALYLMYGGLFLGILHGVQREQIERELHFPQMYTLLEEADDARVEKMMKEQFKNLCEGTSSLAEIEKSWQTEGEIGEAAFMQIEQSYEKWQKEKSRKVQWLLLIPFGICGYFKPELLLWIRQETVQGEKMEEVRRLQTVILVLAQDKSVTVERILEAMEENAVLFRKALQETVDHFSYQRRQSIERLREETACVPMARICDTLFACERIGVREACRGLEEERAYLLRQQVQERLAQMRERAALGKVLAYIPFAAVLALKLILPFVAEGLSQLQLYSDGMSGYF